MRICFVLLSKNPEKNLANYAKISEKFVANNELIQPEYMDSIYALRDQITSSGSRFEKIVTLIMTNSIPDAQEVSNAIIDIASALGPSQSISICDTDDVLTSYLSTAMMDYSDTLKYVKIAKKSPLEIYNGIFGVNARTANRNVINEIQQVVRTENASIEPAPIPVPVSAEPAPIPVPVQEEDEPKKRKFGFPWKRSTRDKLRNVAEGNSSLDESIPEPVPEPIPIPVPESVPVPEPTPIPTPEPTPQPIPVPEPEPIPIPQPIPEPVPVPVPQPESTPIPIPQPTPIPQSEPVPIPQPVFVDESMFTTETPIANPTPIYQSEPEELIAAPMQRTAPAETPTPEVTAPRRGFGKKSKINLPKLNKGGISMQTRPRIVYVTGSGRIGQSTIAASLGFTAAQYSCNSLIVDLDMIKRAISCIYPDYTNINSQQSLGLVAAIRSPHLIDQIAQEHFSRVSTLGITISAADNRQILKSITPLEVQSLLLQALTKYNTVVVDIPWSYLMEHPQLISVPHDIIYCTSNDVMTMISDLNQLTEDAFERLEDFQMLIAKLRFVLNMTSADNAYEGKSITEKNFTKICYELTEEDMFRTIPVLANIPILPNIGNQVSVGQPASAFSKEFGAFCAQILHELK